MGQRTPSYSRMTTTKRVAALALFRDGKTQAEIAQTLGVDPATISRSLNLFVDTRDLARNQLRHASEVMAKRLVEGKDEEVTRKVLTQIEVLPPLRNEGGNNLSVTLGVAVTDFQPRVKIDENIEQTASITGNTVMHYGEPRNEPPKALP